MIAKGFNTITFLMAEWAKMWVRAFMLTTFSSVSFSTCPCKSTKTKTLYYTLYIYIDIVSHHFKKIYKFGTFFLDTNVRHLLKINCNVEISGHAVVRTLDYSSCPWSLAIRGEIRLAE